MKRIDVVFQSYYTPESFWDKVRKFGLGLGQSSLRVVFTLYYCLMDRDTPAWARTTIVAALGYFILPTDLIPDFLPVAGLTDDVAALVSALSVTAAHVKLEHRERAREQVTALLG